MQRNGNVQQHGRSTPRPAQFMFATGIENSYPVITGPEGHDLRVDELEKTHFYSRWREDFALVREVGTPYLRYGPPYHRTHRAPRQYDWAFADETLSELRRLDIEVIADLCHFGVPDWAGSFQNPDWPELYAGYARAFAERYEWIDLFTPVNEIFVCAAFSAQFGWWNERLRSDRAFVTALKHMVQANLRAEEEILKVRPRALFIQSDASSYYHERTPAALPRAEFENLKRFLSLDLSYGHLIQSAMYEYTADNGLSREEYHWFVEHGGELRPHCVLGSDYYENNEHLVTGDGRLEPSGDVFGYYTIAKQYFDRYKLPIMLTETNQMDAAKAPDWLWKLWSNIRALKRDGIPVVGFTWFSLIDQVDWNTQLRRDAGHIDPVGLYDLDRRIRPVGEQYKELIREWQAEVPLQSFALSRIKG